MSAQALDEVIDSSAAFLTAYSSQLQVLTLVIYWRRSAGRLLEGVLQCSQLRSSTVRCTELETNWQRTERRVDVDQLDEAVAALPPLRLLTQLDVVDVFFSVQVITRFLNSCPALGGVELWRVPEPYLPRTIELAGGRRAWIDDGHWWSGPEMDSWRGLPVGRLRR